MSGMTEQVEVKYFYKRDIKRKHAFQIDDNSDGVSGGIYVSGHKPVPRKIILVRDESLDLNKQ